MSVQRASIVLGGAALLLATMACGDDEHVAALGSGGAGASVAVAGSTAASTTSSSASSGAGGDPGPPIRTILQRNPFGNVAVTRNLLWDGDFEWESAFADQYGWLQGQTASVTGRHLGPECRSGIKCGVLGADLIGIAVSSADYDLHASVWVRPGDASCDGTVVFLLAEGIYDDAPDEPIPPVASTPDESGWCHFEQTLPQRNDKAYLYLSTTSSEVSLVDDAVVREATADESRRATPLSAWVPTAATFEKLERAHEAIRKVRRPQDGAPNPARDATVRWARGEGRRRFVASPHATPGASR